MSKVAELYAEIALRLSGQKGLDKFNKSLDKTTEGFKKLSGKEADKVKKSINEIGSQFRGLGSILKGISVIGAPALLLKGFSKAIKAAHNISMSSKAYEIETGDSGEDWQRVVRAGKGLKVPISKEESTKSLSNLRKIQTDMSLGNAVPESALRAGITFGQTVRESLKSIEKNVLNNNLYSYSQKAQIVEEILGSKKFLQFSSFDSLFEKNPYTSSKEIDKNLEGVKNIRVWWDNLMSLDWFRKQMSGKGDGYPDVYNGKNNSSINIHQNNNVEIKTNDANAAAKEFNNFTTEQINSNLRHYSPFNSR